MPLISISGGALFAERLGSGPPRVLALHGWGRRGADFGAALAGLDALALDLPGFGASPPPPTGIGAAGYAELIDPVFGLFDQSPVVIGHSFGGRVAVAREAARPNSASGLLLVASPLVRRPGRARRPPLAYRLVRLAHGLGLLSDQRLEAEKRRHGSADYRAASGVMRDVLVAVVNESYEEELGKIRVPVRLLWGGDDSEVPVAIAQRAARILGQSSGRVELEVLEGVGHHVPLSAPAALAGAVMAMLSEVSS